MTFCALAMDLREVNDTYRIFSVGADIEIGDECQCYVIHVDLKGKNFIASMNEKMIEEVIKRKTKGSSLKVRLVYFILILHSALVSPRKAAKTCITARN